MRGFMCVVIGIVVAALLGILAWSVFQPEPAVTARSTVIGLPSGDNSTGFARAYQPQEFSFPRDHGPHTDYQTEWWYYTGNLTDAAGRHFGYQLTFFRRGLMPPSQMPVRTSDLATSQIYFAHFAVTDSAADKHVAYERFSRGAAGLAGASGAPYNVHLENWSAVSLNPHGDAVRLSAQNGGYSITLDLRALKPIVRQGDQGLSAKSSTPGNASYYYSFTRLETQGNIRTESGTFDVTGLSWMDHEWSTSALGPNTKGWDWFALQLSDQRELMFYQLRNADGSIDPVSAGTLVEPDGSTSVLSRDDVKIEALERWQSPDKKAEYPIAWRISIPSHNITLQVDARIKDQLMNLSTVYWEGAVQVTGQSREANVTGVGYVELTGYSGTLNGRF